MLYKLQVVSHLIDDCVKNIMEFLIFQKKTFYLIPLSLCVG